MDKSEMKDVEELCQYEYNFIENLNLIRRRLSSKPPKINNAKCQHVKNNKFKDKKKNHISKIILEKWNAEMFWNMPFYWWLFIQ